MKVIVCLGNPGSNYKKTRHNVGFRVGASLIEDFSLEAVQDKFKSQCFKGMVCSESVLLLFPQTFMNLSGEAVQACLAWYKLELTDLLIVYDDIDIDFGTLRFRKKGGPGTHNGLKSITQCLGSREFPRLRFGVGPVPGKTDLASFVLSSFRSKEEENFPFLCSKASQTVRVWIDENEDAAMRFSSGVSLD
jgi:peptidyl-tRNA hydrolase, PTH1 family